MLASQSGSLKYGDVSRRTLRVIDIIASWAVNTFYNYLHEEAVTRHSQGRAGSITDGYRQMVKAYLDTFAHHDGYGKIVISLHKYYCDAEKQAMLALDDWIREILGEFIPNDYKSIMTNIQRYDLLRNILINAIEQFSSVVICTPMFDILISNHDEPSLVPSMKESMRGLLLAERHNMFARIHRASTNSEPTINSGSSMKAEIYRLVEENVLLKSKNDKLVAQVKKALDGMKARDRVINALNGDLKIAKGKISQFQMQLANDNPSGFSNIAAILPPPKTPADNFKSSLDSVAMNHGFPVLRPRSKPVSENNQSEIHAPPQQQLAPSTPLPLTHVEEVPEPFTMADPVEDSIIEVDTTKPDESIYSDSSDNRVGSDRYELNMDEFMNN
jgi:regulator of replication initiation timing